MKDPTLVWALWAAVVALAGLLGAVVRALLTGGLVPRNAVDDIRQDRDKWEQAWKLSQEARDEEAARLDANTEALRLVEKIIEPITAKGRNW
jgi:hypothetical protein